jgi:hypothetical protein
MKSKESTKNLFSSSFEYPKTMDYVSISEETPSIHLLIDETGLAESSVRIY